MELINKIIDLPVIIQSTLGSLLFWLIYETFKRSVNIITKVTKVTNNRWKKELLMYEKLSILQDLADVNTSVHNATYLLSIHAALNRAIQAFIYFILGLATQPLIGNFSIIAYLFSIFYLFIALKAAHMTTENTSSEEEKNKRLKELTKELDKLETQKKPNK